jgi:hypothetical protein
LLDPDDGALLVKVQLGNAADNLDLASARILKSRDEDLGRGSRARSGGESVIE